jgi:hypothetical protein
MGSDRGGGRAWSGPGSIGALSIGLSWLATSLKFDRLSCLLSRPGQRWHFATVGIYLKGGSLLFTLNA